MKNKLFWILVGVVGVFAAAIVILVVVTGFRKNNPVKPLTDKLKNATETGISTAHSIGTIVSEELAALTPTPVAGTTIPQPLPDDGLVKHSLAELPITYTAVCYGGGDFSLAPYYQYEFYCVKGVKENPEQDASRMPFSFHMLGIDIALFAPDETGNKTHMSVLISDGMYAYFHGKDGVRRKFYIVQVGERKGGPEYMQRYYDGVVYLDSGVSLQEWLLYYGYARAAAEEGSEEYDAYYRSLEAAAKEAKRGVWADGFGEPEWASDAMAARIQALSE